MTIIEPEDVSWGRGVLSILVAEVLLGVCSDGDWSDPAVLRGYLCAGTMFVILVAITLASFRKALH